MSVNLDEVNTKAESDVISSEQVIEKLTQDKPSEIALISAVQSNNVEIVRNMLGIPAFHKALHISNEEGFSAAFLIIKSNSKEMMEILKTSLETIRVKESLDSQGAESSFAETLLSPFFDYKDPAGYSMLMAAAIAGSYFGSKFLLELLDSTKTKAEAISYVRDLRYWHEKSAIELAAEYGHLEILEMLINYVATSPEERQAIILTLIKGRTGGIAWPTLAAVAKGREKVVNFLLANSKYSFKDLADHRQSHKGNHVLITAIEHFKSIEGVRYILGKAEFKYLIDVNDEFHVSPLYIAIRHNLPEIVRCLINAGANLDSILRRDAVEPEQRSKTVHELLKNDHGISKYCTESFNILDAAVEFAKNLKKFNPNALLESGEFNSYLKKLNSGLNVCISVTARETYTNINHWKTFLKRGASIHQRDGEGNTLLHIAVQRGLLYFIAIFCELGADLEATNHAGLTPLQLAETLSLSKSVTEDHKREIISILSFWQAKSCLKKQEFEMASKLIIRGVLSSSLLSQALVRTQFYYSFATLIKEEYELIKILDVNSVFALFKKIPEELTRVSFSNPLYNDLQEVHLELATFYYMASCKNTADLDVGEVVEISSSQKQLQLMESKESKELKELLEKFHDFLKFEEQNLDSRELLKKAYQHICKTKPCDETSTLRMEITGSLLGLGMRENRLDLLVPEDAIQFLEQHKEQAELIKKLKGQLEAEATKHKEQAIQMEQQKAKLSEDLKAEREKASSLELELQKLREEMLELRSARSLGSEGDESALGSDDLEITQKAKKKFF